MRPALSPSQAGFTLVEMLVALAIFALLSAAGVSILRASVDTQAAVDQRLTQIGGLGRLHALLASDFGQVVDRPTRGPSGERPAFAGDASQMQFVRSGWMNLDQEPRSDLQRVEWRFTGNRLDRTGFASLDGGDELSLGAAFAKGLESAAFRYRVADGSWSAEFRSSDHAALPSAVEMTLTSAGSAPVVMVFALPQAGLSQAEAAS